MDNKILEEDKNFIKSLLSSEIDRLVNLKVQSLSKSSLPIDEDKIRAECELSVFNQLKNEFHKEFDHTIMFYDQLNKDNTNLYHRIIEEMTENIVGSEKNKSFKDLMAASYVKPKKEDLDKVEQIAYSWFEKQHWENASLYFYYLSQVDKDNPIQWLMSGMCQHHLGKFDQALKSYFIATSLAPQNTVAHIQLMRCLIAANHLDMAKQYFAQFLNEFNVEELKKDKYFNSEIEGIKNNLIYKAA